MTWRKRTIMEMAQESGMLAGYEGEPSRIEAFAALVREEALAQPEQEPVAVYGYCPQCGAKGAMRERRPNGNDKCANGHTYPSSTSTPPQRTFVGLTNEERIMCRSYDPEEAVAKTEAKLKEKNT